MQSQRSFFLQLILLLAYTNLSISSSPGSNGSTYKSIRDLDQYGSSPQINNARLASTLHGTLTIAALSIPSNSIIVVSIERKLTGVIIPPNKGKVHIIAQEHGKKVNALVGSGLQSDITYIVSLLRKHASEIWERYDSIPSLDRVAMDATQVMLCFMGYAVQDEINDGTRGVLSDTSGNGDKSDTISIGRPLACNILCLEVGSSMRIMNDMKLVDPSGTISESLVGRAIGRGSNKANEFLRQQWRDDLTTKEIEDVCINVARETVREEAFLSNDEIEHACIVCEVLNEKGLTMRRLPFLPSMKEQ